MKFVFATTEARKIPVTVLSRCQRFDLRRVDADLLAKHFGAIAERENATVDAGALALIGRAADGSVRDGLSLLDQAIGDAGDGTVTESQVRDMLGLADRARIFDLFEAVLGGRVADALDLLTEQYGAGADPVIVLQDLLELTHWLTRVKVTPAAADDPGLPEAERVRGRDMAEKLPIAELSRSWQLLLKGLKEVQTAPAPLQAAEMVLVRLAHAADLPSPADLVRNLQGQGAQPAPSPPPRPAPSGGGTTARAEALAQDIDPAPQIETHPVPRASNNVTPESFEAAVRLFDERREAILCAHLNHDVHLVRYEIGRIELRPEPTAPTDLSARVAACLSEWTGRRWVVTVSNEPGEPTLAQQADAERARQMEEARADPLVKDIMAAFPGAEIKNVRLRSDLTTTESSNPNSGPEQES